MGIDLGSTTAKTVIIDETRTIRAARTVQMGAVSRQGLKRSIDSALETAGLEIDQVSNIVSTGYGRRLVPGVGRTFTEITCHGRGAAELSPGVRLVIDVGGQDSKAILVNDMGLVDNFAMNDRCASGTGRFYEVLARALECEIGEVGALALHGTRDLEVSSMCATFAETEIISLLAEGAEREDIAASVHRAVAARAVGLVSQVGRHFPIVMTGGVAKNQAAVHFLSQALDREIIVPEDPQIVGAFGAALLALESSDLRGDQSTIEALYAVDRSAEEAFKPANRAVVRDCTECSIAGPHTHGPVSLGISIPVSP
jgi:predicted CoA-substrate-specific enzyme activase